MRMFIRDAAALSGLTIALVGVAMSGVEAINWHKCILRALVGSVLVLAAALWREERK